MIHLANISTVYFIGIGGIGMSALARYFNHSGKKVFGYDRNPSPLCLELEREGIEINYVDDPELVNKDADLVVYTPAIPKDHQQYNWYVAEGYSVYKRAAVLGAITKDKFCIAVAGAHGKTTVSTMIAHILNETVGCTAFLGGIATNYESNYLYANSKYVVVEADEFDRSFLTLNPNIAVITSIDSDHLDIYGSLENIEKEFIGFIDKIDDEGTLILHESIGHLASKVDSPKTIITYGKSSNNQFNLNNHRINSGIYHFSIDTETEKIEDLIIALGGQHNILNATAAVAVCKKLGIHNDEIRAALMNFRGVKRRFEKYLDREEIAYIDDYAHHPNEVKALLESLMELYPKRKITAIFQPHLFSRTKDLAAEFGEALSLANQVILLPIYPAREEPIEGVNSEMLQSYIKETPNEVVLKEHLIDYLSEADLDVVVTMGAGDIDRLVAPIYLLLKKQAGLM